MDMEMLGWNKLDKGLKRHSWRFRGDRERERCIKTNEVQQQRNEIGKRFGKKAENKCSCNAVEWKYGDYFHFFFSPKDEELGETAFSFGAGKAVEENGGGGANGNMEKLV